MKIYTKVSIVLVVLCVMYGLIIQHLSVEYGIDDDEAEWALYQ